MTEYRQQFSPQASKTSVIHIASYHDKNLVGTVQNIYYTEPKHFSNLTQLLLDIEESQNCLKYPQRGMDPRSFATESSSEIPPKDYDFGKIDPLKLPRADIPPEGTLATFKLDLLFRQNASWQGSLTWMNKGQEAQFRSVLELIHLIDGVLK